MWNPPTPPPPPPPLVPGGGTHSLAVEEVGESQFRRGDIQCGTLYIYIYFVTDYFLKGRKGVDIWEVPYIPKEVEIREQDVDRGKGGRGGGGEGGGEGREEVDQVAPIILGPKCRGILYIHRSTTFNISTNMLFL
jgi:hypothetical protein